MHWVLSQCLPFVLVAHRSSTRMRMRWHQRKEARGAAIVSSVANLANTNMGVGMLALPAAFGSAGLVGGCLMLFSNTG